MLNCENTECELSQNGVCIAHDQGFSEAFYDVRDTMEKINISRDILKVMRERIDARKHIKHSN